MKILYFQHDASLGGAAWALYQIVADMIEQYEIVIAVSVDGPIVPLLQQLGARVIICQKLTTIRNPPPLGRMAKWVRWACDLLRWKRAARAARVICQQEQPDLVHINTMVLFHLAIGVKQVGNIPVLQHIREHWEHLPMDPRLRIREQACASVDHVLPITEANGRQFGYRGPTTIVHDWADFAGRDGAEAGGHRLAIDTSKKIFLAPGGMIHHKGSLAAIRAMQHVCSKDAVLVVLGGVPERPPALLSHPLVARFTRVLGLEPYSTAIRREADTLGPERVVLMPFTQFILSFMETSYAILSPFVVPHFSKPAVEAGYLKKPVIASDYPEIREVIVENETGILVPPHDEVALAQAIDTLCHNPQLASEMGKNAYLRICEHFSKDAGLQKIRAVYEIF